MKQTILVVDDDAELLGLTAAALIRCGFEVVTASNVADAFAVTEIATDIDLIVTDIVMPGLDGLMLGDMVRLRHPDVRIIYLTGYAETTDRQPGYRYGPTLCRPCRTSELERVVRSVLSRPPDTRGFRPEHQVVPSFGDCYPSADGRAAAAPPA